MTRDYPWIESMMNAIHAHQQHYISQKKNVDGFVVTHGKKQIGSSDDEPIFKNINLGGNEAAASETLPSADKGDLSQAAMAMDITAREIGSRAEGEKTAQGASAITVQSSYRLTSAVLRQGVILSEILAPPLSIRRRK